MVADPYVTSLSGLPSIDLVLDEQRKLKKAPVKNEMYQVDSALRK